MKKNKLLYQILITAIVFILSACTHFNEPPEINNQQTEYSANPVISSIEPPDSAVAGIREIVIHGNNFSANGQDTNWVYIGGIPANIKTVSQDRIVIHRPASFGNSLDINVVIPSALAAARVENYKIEEPVIEFSDFSYQAYDLTTIEVDNNENLFIATRRSILKLTPDGIDITELVYLSSAFAKITDMKFGPGGFLYVLIGKKDLYRIDPETGADEEYVSLPENSDKLDFDLNQNIYVVRRDGIFVINPDKSITATGKLDGIPINEIRVFNGSVYSASDDKLWKNEILDNNGSLGDDQTLLDLNSISGLSNCEISSFNFSEEGEIYLCLKNHTSHSIFALEEDGSVNPYYNANILPQRVDQIIYGSGRYMYLNRGSLSRDSVRLYRMGMKGEGAPYIGRQF